MSETITETPSTEARFVPGIRRAVGEVQYTHRRIEESKLRKMGRVAAIVTGGKEARIKAHEDWKNLIEYEDALSGK